MYQGMTRGFITCALALFVVMSGDAAARADITVTGTGKINVAPDMASISLAVNTESSGATEAMDRNSVAVRRLFKLCEELGIDAKDVQTVSYGIHPRYRYPKDSEPVLIGYTVSHAFQVKVRKLADTGKVLDTMVKEGANRVSGIAFGLADPQPALDEARANAMADAVRKAEIYAKSGKVTLGSVKSVSEVAPVSPIRWISEMTPGAGKDYGVPIAPGEQELSVNVTVVLAIEKSQK